MAEKSFIKASGGTLTTPIGDVNNVKGTIVKTMEIVNTTAPGDSGATDFGQGNATYVGSFRGQALNTHTLAATGGTLTLSLGTIYVTGTALIRRMQVAPDWTTGLPVPVVFTAVWIADVDITS